MHHLSIDPSSKQRSLGPGYLVHITGIPVHIRLLFILSFARCARPYLPTLSSPRHLQRRREEVDPEKEEEEEAWQPPLNLGDPTAPTAPPAPPAPAPTPVTGASISPTAPPAPVNPAPAPTRKDTATLLGQLFGTSAKGDVDAVERLITAGADVNEARSGVTPLHGATQNGHVVGQCRQTLWTLNPKP